MSIRFQAVKTEEDRAALARLADEIWHEYWPSRIGAAQTDYMVETFQSLEAITRDMATNGYEYWFLVEDAGEGDPAGPDAGEGAVLGYTGGHVEPETGRYFISKIYLRPEARGRGLCSETVRFYERLCRERGLSAMYLTVNKENDLGIRAYKGNGFSIIDAVKNPIGGGFFMDDYIMERPVR